MALVNAWFVLHVAVAYVRTMWHVEDLRQMGSTANLLRYQHKEKRHPESLVFVTVDERYEPAQK